MNDKNLTIPSYRKLKNGYWINFSTEFYKVPFYKIIDTKDYQLTEEDINWMGNYTTNNKVDNIFDGKIVHIGTLLPEHNDFKSSPYQSFRNNYIRDFSNTSDMSGVEYHSHAMQTIINNSYNHFLPIDTTNYNTEFREVKIDGNWTIY